MRQSGTGPGRLDHDGPFDSLRLGIFGPDPRRAAPCGCAQYRRDRRRVRRHVGAARRSLPGAGRSAHQRRSRAEARIPRLGYQSGCAPRRRPVSMPSANWMPPTPGSSMATTTGTRSITSSGRSRRSAAAPASRFWPSSRCWLACGRRDAYYAPDQIPAEHRHPHWLRGGRLARSRNLVEGRGFRGMGSSRSRTLPAARATA